MYRKSSQGAADEIIMMWRCEPGRSASVWPTSALPNDHIYSRIQSNGAQRAHTSAHLLWSFSFFLSFSWAVSFFRSFFTFLEFVLCFAPTIEMEYIIICVPKPLYYVVHYLYSLMHKKKMR